MLTEKRKEELTTLLEMLKGIEDYFVSSASKAALRVRLLNAIKANPERPLSEKIVDDDAILLAESDGFFKMDSSKPQDRRETLRRNLDGLEFSMRNCFTPDELEFFKQGLDALIAKASRVRMTFNFNDQVDVEVIIKPKTLKM